MEPILAASSLRVDVAGLPAVDGLTLTTGGERVLVLGAARALFEAAAGLRAVARGELRVEGASPLEAVRAGRVASAPLDPPLPPGWTALEYVRWSARLAGRARAEATELADDALQRMDIGPLGATKLGRGAVHLRRATVIAAALATGAPALLLEDPLAGLPAEDARSFARRVCAGVSGRRTAIFAARVPLESPIALVADEALVVDGSELALRGTPAELAGKTRTYAVRIEGDVPAFAAAVQAGGGRLVGAPGKDDETARGVRHRLSVELGPLGTLDLLRLAAASHAIVLELRPLGRAFA